MARNYSLNLGEETVKGMTEKARAGIYPSGLSQRNLYDAFRSLTVAARLAAINRIRRFRAARVSKRMVDANELAATGS